MSVRTIVRLGHPILREPAREIGPEQLLSAAMEQLVTDLVDTMRAAEGVGLAAPQVAVGLQVFVYQTPANAEPVVLVNPMVEPEPGDPIHDWEGCLSIPGLRGLVPRHPAVRVRALDRHGEPLSFSASGLEARVIQHEYDHLNGVVYLDRMGGLRSLSFDTEWRELVEQTAGGSSEEVSMG